jgi:transcriptional regulator of heat shock response
VTPALFNVKGKTALSTLASLTNFLNQLSRPHVMPNISDVQDGHVPMIIEDDDSMADDNEKNAEELEEEEKKSEALMIPGKTPGDDVPDAQT